MQPTRHTEHIERDALGQVASLGDLYDAKTDTFYYISLLKGAPPKSAITSQDNFHINVEFVKDESIRDQFSKMNITPELQLSVLAGLIPLGGSGNYLKEQKGSNHSVSATLMYNITTKVDRLNLFHGDLKELISPEALGHDGATHVVVEIHWGANSMLKVEAKSISNVDKTIVEGHLNGILQNVGAAVKLSGDTSVGYSKDQADSKLNFSFQVFGDLLPERMPDTFEATIDMMRNLPTLVSNANNGKGKQLKYILLPLGGKALRDYLQTSCSVIKDLEMSCTSKFVRLFDEIRSCSREVNDFMLEMRTISGKYDGCIRKEDVRKMKALMTQILDGEDQLRSQLGLTLRDVRSGRKEQTALDSLYDSYYINGTSYAMTLRDQCEVLHNSLKCKLDFAKLCLEHDVNFITNLHCLENEVTRHSDGQVFVLYASEELKTKDDLAWRRNKSTFFKMIQSNLKVKTTEQPKMKFFYADCDFNIDAAMKGIRIEKYEDGDCVEDDLVKKETHATATSRPATATSKKTHWKKGYDACARSDMNAMTVNNELISAGPFVKDLNCQCHESADQITVHPKHWSTTSQYIVNQYR